MSHAAWNPAAAWALVAAAACATGCSRTPLPASAVPGSVASSAVLPLGPAAPVDVAGDADPAVAPRVDAWGQTLAIAWADRAGRVRVSISPDAGRTFRTDTLGAMPGEGRDALALAVRSPEDVTRPSNDGQADSRVEIWCRMGTGASAPIRRSMNGGRTFDAPIPAAVPMADVFPDPWEATSATTRDTLALLPPPLLRYVGVQKTARPATALDEGLPPMTLDEHGALALIWRERDGAGERRVLRRYAVDWNGGDPTTPEFDAAITVIPASGDVHAPALARAPGGVVAVWVTGNTLRARRIGLDMTCNPNRVR